jgi:predicted nucleic acid-binding protein
VTAPAEAGIWHPKGIIAVLDTSTLVRAWLARQADRTPAAEIVRAAGRRYDSFTSPAILDEVEEVLARPRFGASPRAVRAWLDRFLRVSRQVFPESVPNSDAGPVHADLADVPVLMTAYAVPGDDEFAPVARAARVDGGWFLVSENTRDFTPGWNVWGWRFVTAHQFWQVLRQRETAARS